MCCLSLSLCSCSMFTLQHLLVELTVLFCGRFSLRFFAEILSFPWPLDDCLVSVGFILMWHSSQISDSKAQSAFFFFLRTVLSLYTGVSKDQVHLHPAVTDGCNNFQLPYYFAKFFPCPESNYSLESKFLNVGVGKHIAWYKMLSASLIWKKTANVGSHLSKWQHCFKSAK